MYSIVMIVSVRICFLNFICADDFSGIDFKYGTFITEIELAMSWPLR